MEMQHPAPVGLLGAPTRQLWLTVADPARKKRRRLPGCRVRFGSAANCTVRLRGKAVPRVACLVLCGRARTVVRSYWSAVCLNGRRFEQAELQPGDRLTVGSLVVELWESPRESSSDAAVSVPARGLVRQLRRRLRRMQARLRRLADVRGQLEQRLQEATELSATAERVAADAAHERQAAGERLAEQLAVAREELAAQVAAWEAEHAERLGAERRLTAALDERAALDGRLSAAEAALAEAESAWEALRGEAAELAAQAGRAGAAHEENQRLRALLDLAEADRAAVQTAYERSVEERRRHERSLAEEIASLAAQLAEAQALDRERSAALATAEKAADERLSASNELQRRCDDLQERLSDLERERTELAASRCAERDGLERECERLQTELGRLQQALQAADATWPELELQLAAAQERQRQAETECATARDALAAAEELLAQAAHERTEADASRQRELGCLRDDLAHTRQTLATAAAELDRERAARGAAEELLNQAAQEQVATDAALRTALAEAEQNFAQANAALAAANADLDRERAARAAAEELLNHAAQEQVTTDAALRTALAEAEQNFAQTNAALAAANAELERERATELQLQSELAELAQALAGAQAAAEQRARVGAQLETRLAAQTAELAALSTEREHWQSARDALTATCASARAELETERATRADLQRQLESSQAEQAAAAQELTSLRDALNAARDMLQRIQDLEIGLQNALAAERERVGQGECQIDALRESLGQWQTRCTEAEQSLDARQAELARLQGEVEFLREEAQARADTSSPASAGWDQAERDAQQESEILELRAAAADLRRRCGALEAQESRWQEELECVRAELEQALARGAAAPHSDEPWDLERPAPRPARDAWSEDDALAEPAAEFMDESEAHDGPRSRDKQLDRLADLRREWEQARRQRRGEFPPESAARWEADESEAEEPPMDAAEEETAETPPERGPSPLDTLDVLRRYGFAADGDAAESEPVADATEDHAPLTPIHAAAPSETSAVARTDEEEHASTVDEYMRRLLERVGAKSDSRSDVAGASSARGHDAPRSAYSSAAAAPLVASLPATESEEAALEQAAANYVRRTAPERKSDLSALREVANQSSHLHLAKSNNRSLATQARARGLLVVVTLAAAGGLLWCHALGIPQAGLAAAAAGTISVVALGLYLTTVWRCRRSKAGLESAVALPDARAEPATPDADRLGATAEEAEPLSAVWPNDADELAPAAESSLAEPQDLPEAADDVA